MTLRLVPAAAAALMLLSAPLSADEAADSYEERLQIARDYIEVSIQEMDMAELIEQMWRPVVAQIEKTDGPLRPDQIARIDRLYQDTMSAPMFKIIRDQDTVMADLFTLEEVTDLRDFYVTDTGRAVMKKLPQMLALQQPMILELVQSELPGLIPEVRRIIRD